MPSIDNIQGGVFQDASGDLLASGTISFLLSSPALVTGTGQVVQKVLQIFTLDGSGNVPIGTPLWGNDQLTPSGTFYVVNIYNAQGALVRGPENWSISGISPIDLGTIAAASPSISYPILGIAKIPVAFNATPTFTVSSIFSVFSMTLTGNVTSSTLAATAPSFLIFQITQDGTGNRTFVWPGNFKNMGTIGPAKNQSTTIILYYDGTFAWPLSSEMLNP